MNNKTIILIVFVISGIIFSSYLINANAISQCAIFGNEFDCLNDNGNAVWRVLDSGITVSNGIIQNGNFFDTSHSDKTTSSWTYVSSGIGGVMNSKYLNKDYGSGVMIVPNLYVYNNQLTGGYQMAIYRSHVGIPNNGSPINPNDLLLTQTPTMFPHVDSFLPVPMLTTDAPQSNSTIYYYIAFRSNGGTTTIASSSSIHLEIQ